MKKFSTESLDGLEKGIKQLLLEDRCSFSVDDHALLNDCLELIGGIKAGGQVDIASNVEAIVKVVELVWKLVIAGDHVKGVF
ncbi:MAG TPA: hypothetical protein VIY47_11160 [Ignavibacteriaceae bacterium]